MIPQIQIKLGKKRIAVKVHKCNFIEMGWGLMFSRRESAENLLFSFKHPQKIRIHSFFVFYPFIAVWLDEKFNVTETQIVSPFNPCVSPTRKCFHLVEIPLNKKTKSLGKLFASEVTRR